MSDEDLPGPREEAPSPEQVPPPEVLALASRVVELERAKIQLEARAIEANDEQDNRIATFHPRRLEIDDAADRRRVKLASWTLAGLFVVVGLPLVLFLYMAFWGDEAQREIAIAVVTTVGIGVAGYGILTALARGAGAVIVRR